MTISIDDVVAPPKKAEFMAAAEVRAETVQDQYDDGLITDDERRQELIEIWTRATDEVAEAMKENFPATNPVFMMVNSGARGNWMQVRQIAGMRGLVANPKGEIIPRPIKTNFREGLSVLEYFISTHGARKGLADTALRTADSGYLTRRLVDVSQDVIIREEDCGTDRGLPMPIGNRGEDGTVTPDENVDTSAVSRTLAEDVVHDGQVLAPAGEELSITLVDQLCEAGVESVRLRSVLTCESKVGTCATCYGRSLATGKLVDVGEAVGIIAAQSIGEPGTQLTMRTFHTGGVAGEDITHGLPRVVELFEARTPKGVAPISESAGRVRIEETDRAKKIVIIPDDGSAEEEHPISKRARPLVADGDHVEVGQQLIVGAVDPKKVLRILGQRAVQLHLVDQVQEVYRSQGVSIHDKHIEVIVRQMLKRVTIIDSGDAGFLPGSWSSVGSSRPRTVRLSPRAASRPRHVPSSWASPRRRWPPSRGCRRPPSRRPPGCSPTPRSRPSATRCWASRRTSSSASSSRPARACPATATSRSSRPRRPRRRCTRRSAATRTPSTQVASAPRTRPRSRWRTSTTATTATRHDALRGGGTNSVPPPLRRSRATVAGNLAAEPVPAWCVGLGSVVCHCSQDPRNPLTTAP